MDPVTAATPGPVAEAQMLMLRRAMDMALQRGALLLEALPPPPPAASPAGVGGRVDVRA